MLYYFLVFIFCHSVHLTPLGLQDVVQQLFPLSLADIAIAALHHLLILLLHLVVGQNSQIKFCKLCCFLFENVRNQYKQLLGA